MTSQYKNHTACTRAARGTRIAASATTTPTSHNDGVLHLNAVTSMYLIADLSFSSQRSTGVGQRSRSSHSWLAVAPKPWVPGQWGFQMGASVNRPPSAKPMP